MVTSAQAQTAEIIGSVSQAAEWYTGAAGIVAGTWAIVSILAIGLGGYAIHKLIKRLEQRDQEIADLKVSCAQEIAQVKISAQEAADQKVDMAWKRVDQIYNSVQTLFGKNDATAEKTGERLEKIGDKIEKLTLQIATRG